MERSRSTRLSVNNENLFSYSIIWMQGEKDQFGIGFAFPVTGARNFDSQILVSYIHSF